MTRSKWNALMGIVAPALVLGVSLLVGCGVDVERSDKKVNADEIKTWSNTLVRKIEAGIAKKDMKTPSRVMSLANQLQGLKQNITVGPGAKFQNSEQAIMALDQCITQLRNWWGQSQNYPRGIPPEQLDKLQTILDNLKKVMSEVKVKPVRRR